MEHTRDVQKLLSAFRSLPESEARPVGRDAKSLGEVIADVVKKYALEEPRPEQKIVENWTAIVGEAFAGRCGPKRITHDGKLVIQVMGATARQELAFRKRDILTAVRKLRGCRMIKAVTFVTS